MITLTLSSELDADALARIFSFLNEGFTVAINGIDYQVVKSPDAKGLDAVRFDDATSTLIGGPVHFDWHDVSTVHVY